MSKEVLAKAVDTLPRTEETIWDFIGGEPLLEIGLIDYASNLIVKLPGRNLMSTTTNGTQFNRPEVRRVLEKYSKKRSVGLSLDGPKHVHDANRCNSFDQVMEYFDWWKKTFPWCSTKSTVNKRTLPYLAESIQFLVELGLKTIPINLVYEEAWDSNDEDTLREQLELASTYLKWSGKLNEVEVTILSKNFSTPPETRRNWCGTGEHMVAVDPVGNLYPCNRFSDLKLPPIGTLDTGVNPERLFPFLVSHKKLDGCDSCDIMGKCPGCLAYDYEATGTLYKRAINNCNMHKIVLEANKKLWLTED